MERWKALISCEFASYKGFHLHFTFHKKLSFDTEESSKLVDKRFAIELQPTVDKHQFVFAEDRQTTFKYFTIKLPAPSISVIFNRCFKHGINRF